MFVFYDINDLMLLQLTKLLPSINVPILIAEGMLRYHSHPIPDRVKMLEKDGLVQIKPLDEEGYKFVLNNKKNYRQAGCALLEVFHMCQTHNAILIVGEEETLIRSLATQLGIKTFTMDEFNQSTVNNKEYFEFINEIKKEKQKLNL